MSKVSVFLLVCCLCIACARLHPRQGLATVVNVRGGSDRRKSTKGRYAQPRYGPNAAQPAREDDRYQYDRGPGPMDDEYGQYHVDTVESYTRTSAGKGLVSVSAALTAAALAYLIQSMILSHTFRSVVYAAGAVGGAFVFLQGDWAEFFRSLGVFSILLLRRASPQFFLPRTISQLKSFFQISERRPFPPEKGQEPDIVYPMLQGLFAVLFLGGLLGMAIVKPIPLFPSWLGFILGAAVLTYVSSFGDSTGDLVRFIAYVLIATLAGLSATAQEVALQEKTGTIFGHTLFFFNGLDEKFEIRRRVRELVGEGLSKLTLLMVNMRSGDERSRQPRRNNNDRNTNSNRGDDGYYSGRREGRQQQQYREYDDAPRDDDSYGYDYDPSSTRGYPRNGQPRR